MSRKIRSFFAVIFALALAASVTVTASAADDAELKINSTATAKVGDTVKYSIYLADADKDVLGIDMSVFYDKEHVKLIPDSITYEKFDGAVQNPNLDGYFKFTWTQINDEQNFSNKAMLVSADFEVTAGGEADFSYFITNLYGNIDTLEELKTYTLTCDIAVNNEVVAKDLVPVVNEVVSAEKKMQGDFTNYIDGKGDNSPNSDDHKAVIVEKKYISQNVVTEVVDVTQSAEGTGGNNSTTIILIVAVVVVVLAVIAIVIVKRKDDKKAATKETTAGNNASDDHI